MGNKNPRSAYFSPKNWLWGSVSGLNGKRYSQQPVQDYEVNEDGTITAYGGTYNVSTDAQGRKYFDVLIPEYDPKTKTGPYLNRGFDHIDSSGRVIGRGETYNRYYIGNLLPIIKEEPVKEEQKKIVEYPAPKQQYITNVYYPDGRLFAKRVWEEGKKGKSWETHDGADLNELLNYNWFKNSPNDDDYWKSSMTSLSNVRSNNSLYPGSYYYIKSGNWSKPGNVYLGVLKIENTPRVDTVQNNEFQQNNKQTYYKKTTPNKLIEILNNTLKLRGIRKTGGKIDYLKFYK